MTTPIVFGDAVQLCIEHLEANLATYGQSSVTVAGTVPNPRPEKLVVVHRDGGQRRSDLVVDRALLGFEAWAPTAPEAHDLAQTARALILGLARTNVSGFGQVYSVDEAAGPAFSPDPETHPPVPRYLWSLELHLRGTALTAVSAWTVWGDMTWGGSSTTWNGAAA